MHIKNLEQFLPESYFLLLAIIIFITYWTIKSIKNYFLSIKDAYKTSNCVAGKSMMILNKVSIVSLLFLPYIFALLLIICPFGFDVNGKTATINDYSGNRAELNIPSHLFFWEITEIDANAFENNQNIEKISIPSTIRRIGESAFEGCTNVEQIEIPDSVSSIGNRAFANCSSLETVTYSNNLTSIGAFSFANCKKLKNVSLPSSETNIGTGAFINTIWLYNNESDYVIIGDNHYIYIGDELNVEVPEGVKTVDFYDNSKIQSVIMPESFGSFKDYCFQGCESLLSITPLDGHWGAYCFGGCHNLSGITWTGKYIRSNTNIYYADYNRPFEVDNEFRIQQRNINK